MVAKHWINGNIFEILAGGEEVHHGSESGIIYEVHSIVVNIVTQAYEEFIMLWLVSHEFIHAIEVDIGVGFVVDVAVVAYDEEVELGLSSVVVELFLGC